MGNFASIFFESVHSIPDTESIGISIHMLQNNPLILLSLFLTQFTNNYTTKSCDWIRENLVGNNDWTPKANSTNITRCLSYEQIHKSYPNLLFESNSSYKTLVQTNSNPPSKSNICYNQNPRFQKPEQQKMTVMHKIINCFTFISVP